MNLKMYQRAGFTQTLVAALLLVLVCQISRFKYLFVPETGNIRILGNFGLLLALGMLLRWRYVRVMVGILMCPALLMLSYGASPSQEFFLSYLALMFVVGLIIYFTLFSKAVKTYFGSDE
jgi:hypothetical protein